jgi:hypothetical protein
VVQHDDEEEAFTAWQSRGNADAGRDDGGRSCCTLTRVLRPDDGAERSAMIIALGSYFRQLLEEYWNILVILWWIFFAD